MIYIQFLLSLQDILDHIEPQKYKKKKLIVNAHSSYIDQSSVNRPRVQTLVRVASCEIQKFVCDIFHIFLKYIFGCEIADFKQVVCVWWCDLEAVGGKSSELIVPVQIN